MNAAQELKWWSWECKWGCVCALCSAFFGWRNRHLRMSLSSGRIVVTKFPSTGYKMLFLSFITLTRERERERDRGRSRQKWRRKPVREDRQGGGCVWLHADYSQRTLLHICWIEEREDLPELNCYMSVKYFLCVYSIWFRSPFLLQARQWAFFTDHILVVRTIPGGNRIYLEMDTFYVSESFIRGYCYSI